MYPVYCCYQPPGRGNRLPEVFCVVSTHEARPFYEQLLLAVERKRYMSMEHAQQLIQAAYAKPLPLPGKEAWVRSMVGCSVWQILTLLGFINKLRHSVVGFQAQCFSHCL